MIQNGIDASAATAVHSSGPKSASPLPLFFETFAMALAHARAASSTSFFWPAKTSCHASSRVVTCMMPVAALDAAGAGAVDGAGAFGGDDRGGAAAALPLPFLALHLALSIRTMSDGAASIAGPSPQLDSSHFSWVLPWYSSWTHSSSTPSVFTSWLKSGASKLPLKPSAFSFDSV